MKSRYLFFAAGVAFLIAAVVEWVHLHNIRAALLDAGAAAIFLYLGISRPR